MKPEQKKQPQPRGDVEVGDELYVHHKGQSCSGRVVCHGAHGVTLNIDGAQHKTKWDKVLGHKKRQPMKFKVIEHGEDGMLVEDAHGKRRFVNVPPEARETHELAKALTATDYPDKTMTYLHQNREVVLFFKALSKAEEKPAPDAKTDDANADDQPQPGWNERPQGAGAPQDGQHVAFRNGEHRGHGKVTAAGEHGVTVADKAGGEHRVRHDQVTHDWQGEGEPNQEPPPDTTSDDEVLDGYDGKVTLPGELVSKLLKEAPQELRAEVANFLREKSAGEEVERDALDAAKPDEENPDERQEKLDKKDDGV